MANVKIHVWGRYKKTTTIAKLWETTSMRLSCENLAKVLTCILEFYKINRRKIIDIKQNMEEYLWLLNSNEIYINGGNILYEF